jgi:predicted PurR-regulated permease PerM
MVLSDFTARKIGKSFIALLLLAIVIYITLVFFDIILMLTISILIALIFNPLVTVIEKHGVSRLISVLIVFVLTGVVIFLGLSIFIPKIITQLNAIANNLTQEEIANLFKQIEEEMKNYLPFIDSEDLASQLSKFSSNLIVDSIDNISNIVSSIVSVIAISVIVPFMTFFLLKDNKRIVKGIINIMPNRYFEMSYSVIKQISTQLGRFVRGWILDAFLVGFMAAVGLAILGIQNSVTIGFVAGIGHLIPYFGPILGGVPAILISVIQFGDFSMFPTIVILFVIIYTIDNGYIQPNVFSKSTDIHPLIIIILILVGNQAMGIFGMLIAVPTATVIKTAAREIYNGFKNYKIIRRIE